MAGVNIEEIRRRKAEAEQRKADSGGGNRGERAQLWKVPVGTTLIALAPPGSHMDGVPYIDFAQHRDVGPRPMQGGGSVICLNYENPLLSLEPFAVQISERNEIFAKKQRPQVELDGACPVCDELSGETGYTDGMPDSLKKMSPKRNAACLIAVVGKLDGNGNEVLIEPAKLHWQPFLVPQTIAEGFDSAMVLCGDVTNLDGMILLCVGNTGSGFARYSVQGYPPSIVRPWVAPKPLRAALKQAEPGGDLDLFRILAFLTKSHADAESLLRGIEVSHSSAPPEAEGKPQCFGSDSCDPDDLEWCGPCPFKVECAGKTGKAVPKASATPWPHDKKTWADRGMTDPALSGGKPAPSGKPAPAPTGKPAASAPAPAPAPAQRPAAAPAAAPAATPAATRPAAAPATAAATRPAAAPAAQAARPAPAPAAAPARPAAAAPSRPVAAPGRPAVAPAPARPATAPAAAAKPRLAAVPPPVAEPDPEEELTQPEPEWDGSTGDEIPVGPGEEYPDLDPADGGTEAAGEDELDSFERELLGQ